ncbi:MAG: cyclase family protein [Caldilinea sp. CFX5]|nr:cyclase family protein [Caldilinea sp. CFX5]
MPIIDLTHPLEPTTPVFPDYPPVGVKILEAIGISTPVGRRALNSSQVTVGLHCGTHVDAPAHFYNARPTIEQTALEKCVGPALLIDLTPKTLPAQSVIDVADLASYVDQLRETGKVILKTGWAQRWGDPAYFTEHPVMTGEAAQFLVDCGVHLIGVDTPSVDRPSFPAHLVLLDKQVVILENLTNLDAIPTPRFQLVALPLKLTGREASPVRAIAIL